MIIDYHPGRPKVIAYTLSLFVLRALNTRLTLIDDGHILVELKAKPTFLQQICEAQKIDNEFIAKKR